MRRGPSPTPGTALPSTNPESGRRAWKANAPEGVTRTIIEDGEPWLDSVVGMFSERLADWMEGRGATL